jgi:alpha-L-arabinofuranosidase
VAAAWTEDRRALTVAIVNPTRSAQKLQMELTGANLAGTGRLWTIGGPDDMAYNEPGKEPQVTIEEKAVSGISGSIDVTPISISLFRLDVK